MKKLIALTIVITLCLSIAGIAYAEKSFCTSGCDYTSTSIGGGMYQTSTGVTLKVKSSATMYCAATQHQSSTSSNGGKQYVALYNKPSVDVETAADSGPTSCSSDSNR